MNAKNLYQPLDLTQSFLQNINNNKYQNDKETELFVYENNHVYPPFRYYNDNTNLNFSAGFLPPYTYKTKSLFPAEKPSQTEHDEIGINESFLNRHFGYTDYGLFNVANQSLPEANKHSITSKNNLFELV